MVTERVGQATPRGWEAVCRLQGRPGEPEQCCGLRNERKTAAESPGTLTRCGAGGGGKGEAECSGRGSRDAGPEGAEGTASQELTGEPENHLTFLL